MVPRVGELIQESWRQATPELIAWARGYFAARPNAKKQTQLELERWRKGFAEGRTPTDRSTDDGLRYCAFLEAMVGPVRRDVYWATDRKDASRLHTKVVAGISVKSKAPTPLTDLVKELHFGYRGQPAIRTWVLDMMKTDPDVRLAVQQERDKAVEMHKPGFFHNYLSGFDEYVAELAKDYDISQFDWKEASRTTLQS